MVKKIKIVLKTILIQTILQLTPGSQDECPSRMKEYPLGFRDHMEANGVFQQSEVKKTYIKDLNYL